MEKGEVYGRGACMITTPAGEARVREAGLEAWVQACGTMLASRAGSDSL
jgi:hypothetical protein